MEKIMIIMRGVPNSGKTYQAKLLCEGDETKIFSTDDFFERQEGGYRANWAGDKLYGAHKWNERRVLAALKEGITPVIVDNTNLRVKDARPYHEMALANGYEVQISESKSPWWHEIVELLRERKKNEVALKQWAGKLAHGFSWGDGEDAIYIPVNSHGVPDYAIYNYLMRYQHYTVEDL